MSERPRAYVGLGGNLGGLAAVRARFDRVLDALDAWPEVAGVRASPRYTSAPVGPIADQPRFLNAVVELTLRADSLQPDAESAESTESAEPNGFRAPPRLLSRLLSLEVALGRDRDRSVPQGPRAIDLDLLLFGDHRGHFAGPPSLTLPHPGLTQRAFALVPLADLVGLDFRLPGGTRIADCLAALDVAAQRADLTLDVRGAGAAG